MPLAVVHLFSVISWWLLEQNEALAVRGLTKAYNWKIGFIFRNQLLRYTCVTFDHWPSNLQSNKNLLRIVNTNGLAQVQL